MSTDWSKPQEVDGIRAVFPAGVDDLLPPYDEIPEEFKEQWNTWVRFQADWFFSGLPAGTEFVCKDGIDKSAALRHLKCVMGSWESKHEHKQAGVAYLASLWFERVETPVLVYGSTA